MKKLLSSLLVAMIVTMLVAGTALTAPSGMPTAHRIDGRTFDAVVSGLAQSAPGAITDHVYGR
jgi:hypothetical protein